MGGFEGGDEGGYWDDATIFSPKKNVVKREEPSIEVKDSVYSVKVHRADHYDTISFIPCKCESFTIEGCDGISLEKHPIFQAYKALNDAICDEDMIEFFKEHKVVLNGNSGDVGAFLRLVKEACNLVLSPQELEAIEKSYRSM